jgi:NCS1 family nucleobase:cation symporter-1
LGYEANGINMTGEDERKDSPRSLFWPWFAANISVLGFSYGTSVLDIRHLVPADVRRRLIGIIASFLLVGFVATAGKCGSAPTLVFSRGPRRGGIRSCVCRRRLPWSRPSYPSS